MKRNLNKVPAILLNNKLFNDNYIMNVTIIKQHNTKNHRFQRLFNTLLVNFVDYIKTHYRL